MALNVLPFGRQREESMVKFDPSELEQCYELLEVKADASPSEIKQAYWDLVKVWNPGRFSDDPRLQGKVRDKLERIDTAFNYIKAHRSDFSPPTRQSVDHQVRVEIDPPGIAAPREEAAIVRQRNDANVLDRDISDSPVEWPQREVAKKRDYTDRDSTHRHFLVKCFWGFVIGVMLALPVSGAFFLVLGGLAAAISFNVTWIGVLALALRRKP